MKFILTLIACTFMYIILFEIGKWIIDETEKLAEGVVDIVTGEQWKNE